MVLVDLPAVVTLSQYIVLFEFSTHLMTLSKVYERKWENNIKH